MTGPDPDETVVDESHCDHSGRCEAAAGARKVTSCIYCGKELREGDDGWWYTWDAFLHDNPARQCPVVPKVEDAP